MVGSLSCVMIGTMLDEKIKTSSLGDTVSLSLTKIEGYVCLLLISLPCLSLPNVFTAPADSSPSLAPSSFEVYLVLWTSLLRIIESHFEAETAINSPLTPRKDPIAPI